MNGGRQFLVAPVAASPRAPPKEFPSSNPTYRTIPLGTTEDEVKLYHMHIDTRFGQEDLDVVLQARRESDVHPPIEQLLVRKPWLLTKLYTGEIPDEV